MRSEERQFFQKVKKAITCNPFSQDRLQIDLELTGLSSQTSIEKILGTLVTQVERSIREVLQQQVGGFAALNDEERELLQYGVLFHLFHLFSGQYDEHIRQQISEGDRCCPLTFAPELMEMLHRYGFSGKVATRYVALFFQMRRAYYFIRQITGESACIREVRIQLWNNIFTHDLELYNTHLWNRLEDFSTMLLGETGTGKGLAASAIGRSGYIPFDERRSQFSESFARSFLSINLSQFPEQLIASELFGHRKGAFTGAVDSHKGVFSRCSPHGAIFLDEIGDVSIPVQVTLLRVLQERIFSPVGSRESERFNGRVIAATNKSLGKMRQDGKMRDDFYYRLCSDTIEIPPLRRRLQENSDEIFILLRFIIGKIVGSQAEDLVQHVGGYIRKNQPANYPWPGNIRELEQCVRRILIHNSCKWQQPTDDNEQRWQAALSQGELTAQELLARYCAILYTRLGTYEAVAQCTALDRRTVKKYIQQTE